MLYVNTSDIKDEDPDDLRLPLCRLSCLKDDVLTGWTIGAISAAVAVRWVIYPETYWRRSTMEKKNLEEHMEINMLPDGQNNAFTLIDPTYGSAGYSPHDQKQNPIASV